MSGSELTPTDTQGQQPPEADLSLQSAARLTTRDSASSAGRVSVLLVAGLLLLALGVRMGAAWVIDRQVTAAGRQFLIEGDANGYWELGQKLARGDDYAIHSPPRRILRTPGFPLLLAASIRIFGDSILAASMLMAVIGTACCWLTYQLARRLFGTTVACGALLLTAVSPLQVGSNVQILSETWFTFWVLLSLWTLSPLLRMLQFSASGNVSHPETPNSASENPVTLAWWGFRAGLVTGFGVLVRPGWILWPILACLLLILFPRVTRRPYRLLTAAMLCFGCWCVLLPWALRNASVCGHMVYTSLWSGPSLYDGLNQDATGASDMRFLDQEGLYNRFSEYEVNEQYKQRAWDFAMQNPTRAIWLAMAKIKRFLNPGLQAQGFSGGYFSLLCLIWYGFFWTFVLIGVLTLRRHTVPLALLAAPFLLFLLVHMVFVGSVRYRLPTEFPLSILGAHGMASLLHRWWGTRTNCHTSKVR